MKKIYAALSLTLINSAILSLSLGNLIHLTNSDPVSSWIFRGYIAQGIIFVVLAIWVAVGAWKSKLKS